MLQPNVKHEASMPTQPLCLPDTDTSDIQNKQQVKIIRMSRIKKEKSRDAARWRRGKENYEFYELAKLLPIPTDASSQLDKASIVRLTMSYLQLQEFFRCGPPLTAQPMKPLKPAKCDSAAFMQSNLLQSLDGFIIVLNKKGRFLYVSNTVSIYLGLAQVDLIGTSIFNYVHPSDHTELADHFNNKCCDSSRRKFCRKSSGNDELKNCCCSFFIRMKSTLTRRGMTVKSSGYKVVHVTGCLTNRNPRCDDDDDSSSNEDGEETPLRDPVLGFSGMAQVLPLVDIRLDEPMFVMRLDPSLRATYCEERIKLLTSYEPSEVKGCTIYQFIHTSDLSKIRTCHIEILNKGQVVTPYYRWLLKNGSYVWVQSYVALLLDKHQSLDEDAFVWITYVLSVGKDSVPDQTFQGIPDVTEDTTTKQKDDCVGSIKEEKSSGKSDEARSRLKATTSLDNKVAPNRVVHCHTQTTGSNISEAKNGDISKGKLTKQLPDKIVKLKRTRSANYTSEAKNSFEMNVPSAIHNVKREKLDLDEQKPSRSSSASSDQSKSLSKAEDVLDVHSTMWYNPPNREVSNQRDLNTTVIHHHYPYGIDPNLLNSNPLFAKMLTANYVSYESLLTRDAFIFTPPSFLTPVLNTMPGLVPGPPADISCCPPSVATIIDELRKDPMRKINPPNKVVLSSSRIPPQNNFIVPAALINVNSNTDQNSPESSSSSGEQTLATIPRPILTLSDVSSNGIFLAPLGGYTHNGTNPPLILHPLKLTHNVAELNSLPI